MPAAEPVSVTLVFALLAALAPCLATAPPRPMFRPKLRPATQPARTHSGIPLTVTALPSSRNRFRRPTPRAHSAQASRRRALYNKAMRWLAFFLALTVPAQAQVVVEAVP